MISSTQALLLTGRLKIARSLPHAALLARELVNFRFNLGHERSEDALDWHEGPDDDLVLALAIATWQAERNPGLGFSCSYFIGRGESERPACFADLYRAAMGNCPTSWRAQPSVSGSPRRSADRGRPTPAPFADVRDRLSGCFSNEHVQHPLGVEILDSKRQVHRAFARPAAERLGCRRVRRRPTEVSMRHRPRNSHCRLHLQRRTSRRSSRTSASSGRTTSGSFRSARPAGGRVD